MHLYQLSLKIQKIIMQCPKQSVIFIEVLKGLMLGAECQCVSLQICISIYMCIILQSHVKTKCISVLLSLMLYFLSLRIQWHGCYGGRWQNTTSFGSLNVAVSYSCNESLTIHKLHRVLRRLKWTNVLSIVLLPFVASWIYELMSSSSS